MIAEILAAAAATGRRHAALHVETYHAPRADFRLSLAERRRIVASALPRAHAVTRAVLCRWCRYELEAAYRAGYGATWQQAQDRRTRLRLLRRVNRERSA